MKLLFEWNADKAASNLKKHKVSFDEAKTLFNDPLLATFPDSEHSAYEQRFVSIGISAKGRVLLAAHTETMTTDYIVVRLISCRRATAAERKVYEEAE
jgi:uncharacterized protein